MLRGQTRRSDAPTNTDTDLDDSGVIPTCDCPEGILRIRMVESGRQAGYHQTLFGKPY